MAYQSLDLGTSADDGTGDSLRLGGDKLNDNFSELYTLLGTGSTLTTGISATGSVVTLTSAVGTFTTLTPVSADGTALGSTLLEWSDLYLADSSVIYFGADQEITLTHVHNVGLTLTHVTADDNLPIVLQLKSEEDAVVADEVIASIEFAAGDSDGTDGATVAAGIHAIAEGTFSATANATKLVFTTGVSETAASSATAKMTLSSGGNLDILGVATAATFEPDGDTSAGDDAAIGYTSAEGLILTGQGSTSDITLKNDADATVFTVPTGSDDILFPDSARALFGAGSDLQLYHDGSNSYIDDAGTGALKIRGNASVNIEKYTGEAIAEFTADGAVTLRYDGAIKFATSAAGVTVTGALDVTTTIQGTTITAETAFVPDASDGAALGTTSLEFSDLFLADGGIIYFGDDQDVTLEHVADTGLRFPDSDKLMFGAGSDLQIYHDGSNSYVSEQGTGTLNVQGTNLALSSSTGEYYLFGSADGATTLYHNNVEKLATSAAGVTVTGALDVTTTIQGTTITAETAFVPDASDGASLGTTSLEFSDLFLADGAVINFGDDDDVTLTHANNSGLVLKNAVTADDNPVTLTLQTGETDMAANDVMGKISFQAPGEGSGTDAALIAAAIQARAEGDFSSSSNATSIDFMTGVSEAAATKMSLSSGGNLDVVGDITGATLNADGDTAAGDNAAIGYTAAEGLILTGQGSTSDITLKNDNDGVVFTVPSGTSTIVFPDSARANFGAGSDLQIFHDGNNSFIQDQGTGNLYLDSVVGNIYLRVNNNENAFEAVQNGAVTLYHNNAAKIATASTGVTITGEATATGFTGTLDGILGSGTAAAASVTTLNTSGQVIFNEAGADIDFRVEGNGEANCIFVAAGENRVGIGTASPANLLQVGPRNDTETLSVVAANGGASMIMRATTGTLGTLGSTNNVPVNFLVNNAEKMRILADGKVGIGIAAPTATLDVLGNSDSIPALKLGANATHGWNFYDSASNGDLIIKSEASNTQTETFRLPRVGGAVISGGNVGIGVAAPASLLEIKAAALNRANGISFRGSGANDVLYIYPSANNLATIEHLIDGSTDTGGAIAINPQGGHIGICNTGASTAVGWIFNDTGFVQHARPSGSAQSMTGFYNGGSLVGEIRSSTSATAYLTSSDYRLKEEVAPMTNALAKVAQLKPCTYKWKLNGEAAQGFIAHELQEVVPEAVAGVKDELDEDGNPKHQGVDTGFLVATLTAAIQEQQATIEALTARITALEG